MAVEVAQELLFAFYLNCHLYLVSCYRGKTLFTDVICSHLHTPASIGLMM